MPDSTTPAGSDIVELERWGFRWKGHDNGTHERMADGYWTPWHIAAATIESARAEIARLKAELERRSANEKRNCQNWGPCSKMDEGGTHAGG